MGQIKGIIYLTEHATNYGNNDSFEQQRVVFNLVKYIIPQIKHCQPVNAWQLFRDCQKCSQGKAYPFDYGTATCCAGGLTAGFPDSGGIRAAAATRRSVRSRKDRDSGGLGVGAAGRSLSTGHC